MPIYDPIYINLYPKFYVRKPPFTVAKSPNTL